MVVMVVLAMTTMKTVMLTTRMKMTVTMTTTFLLAFGGTLINPMGDTSKCA